VPVLVVLAGVVIGASILWRTAPEEDDTTRATPTVSESMIWKEFVPDDGSFRAEYPAPPYAEDTVSPVDGRAEQSYVAMVNEQLFAVIVSDTGAAELAPGTSDAGASDAEAEAVLRRVVGRFAQARKATVGEANYTHVSTAPALDYGLDGQAVQSRGRAVLLGRQMFNVVVSAPQLAPGDVERFLDSFALT
jgi:hypothetical protein